MLTAENDPVVVIFTGDDARDIYPGYQLDKESGTLNPTDFMVDETYAQNNEVWVVSLNEQVQQNIVQGGGGGGGGGGSSPTPGAVVDQIKCKCHKESWAAGASEVHIITVVSDWGFYNAEVNVYGKSDHEGGQIYKFSRKDVNRERNKDVNFYIVNNWDQRAPGMPYGNYVIFEYDTWPTGLRTVRWYHGSVSYPHKYRSADGYYDKATVYKTNFDAYYVSNGCIEWHGLYFY